MFKEVFVLLSKRRLPLIPWFIRLFHCDIEFAEIFDPKDPTIPRWLLGLGSYGVACSLGVVPVRTHTYNVAIVHVSMQPNCMHRKKNYFLFPRVPRSPCPSPPSTTEYCIHSCDPKRYITSLWLSLHPPPPPVDGHATESIKVKLKSKQLQNRGICRFFFEGKNQMWKNLMTQSL